MKKNLLLLPLLLLLLLPFNLAKANPEKTSLKLPFKKAGLTERQAAAHLLSRFTFGAKPGQIDEVVKMGLENWLQQQLLANAPNPDLEQKLARFEALKMNNQQIVATFPFGGQTLRMAIKDGVLEKNDIGKGEDDPEARKAYRAKLEVYMQQKGLKPARVLQQQVVNQKILRAAYSQNQLQEVLTSFWFNHFNVSLSNRNAAPFILSYERDVIRPNVLGSFEQLLLATAKSPAMLVYLDNFKSTVPQDAKPKLQRKIEDRIVQKMVDKTSADTSGQAAQFMEKSLQARKAQGLNENYAREIMELHTLGVDGGYTQQDVTQAARVFTGWTVNPAINGKNQPPAVAKAMKVAKVTQLKMVQDGDFLFLYNRHDRGAKQVLGTNFPAGGGYEEGVQLIKLLAQHPATAKFISTKLAVRFVNDSPAPSLVEKMAQTFQKTNGDIKAVLATMVSSPEFWSKEALREKTKSPFELAISSVRSLNADVVAPAQLATWITKMGEQLYAYQAPTGFPDKGAYWINTGSLLNRMNFGLALASNKIPGVKLDLEKLNQSREPESAQEALTTYGQFLLPERDLTQTIKQLSPVLQDPALQEKVNTAASKTPSPYTTLNVEEEENTTLMEETTPPKRKKSNRKGTQAMAASKPQPELTEKQFMLAQVVGVLIGSPEFQRR
ncbi:DUF1800 domain-containing protein [Rufibacter sp. LB8]|uniref:DUF1800 domain-containing protein n=1 Tax=Rufibacter sp. LB8 TaxID=2777781 RepID=UPI00178C584B|nr:DUF1800 domain-containing protein [Rufibacter sp. LB8]